MPFIHSMLPLFEDVKVELNPLELQDWRQLKPKLSNSTPGPEGWLHSELKVLPDLVIKQLLCIYNAMEERGDDFHGLESRQHFAVMVTPLL